jgi:hypothetical protein
MVEALGSTWINIFAIINADSKNTVPCRAVPPLLNLLIVLFFSIRPVCSPRRQSTPKSTAGRRCPEDPDTSSPEHELAMAVPREGLRLAGGRCLAFAALTLALVAISPLGVHAEYTYVTATAGGVVTEFPCAPQYNAENTTASFHMTNASAVHVTVKVKETCVVTGSAFEFNASALDSVPGKIAVIPGSACPFETYEGTDMDPWFYYLRDFQVRVDQVIAAGAVGVIWGEGKAGKIPEQMVGHKGTAVNQAKPVCTMSKETFDAFVQANLTVVDTTNALMYRTVDERYPEPRYTYVSVEEPWKPNGPNGFVFPIPAKTATFGPRSFLGREADLVDATFVDACVANSDEYETCASKCWPLPPSEKFTQDLTGKIAFFTRSADAAGAPVGDSGCYPYFNNWAKLSQDAGAAAVIHGTRNEVSTWRYAGPYQVPFNLTIPFFSLMKLHTETLEHVREESASHTAHDVTLKLPTIADGAGPSYFASEEVDFGPAPVMIWRDEDVHFYCDAGQAMFNPAPWGGLPLPENPAAATSFSASENTNRLVVLWPSDACHDANTNRGTCGACLAPGPSGHVAQLWARIDGEEVTVNVSATIRGAPAVSSWDVPRAAQAAFGETFAAVMFVEDFGCFASYEEFAMTSETTGASALLLVMPQSPYLAPNLYGVADVAADGARRATPTFSITRACALRALQGGNDVRVDLPAIGADGNAIMGPHAHAAGYLVPNLDQMEATSFLLHEAPSDLCGGNAPPRACLAGQANFNPASFPAVRAEVLFVKVVPECQSWWTCLECDRLASGAAESATYLRYLDAEEKPLLKGAVAGRVAFLMERDARCAHPYTNFVRDMQVNGALGIILGLESSSVQTLTASAVPFAVTIPTFTLANAHAVEFEAALSARRAISVVTPVLANGKAVEGSLGTASVDEGTLRLGKNHGGSYPGDASGGAGQNTRRIGVVEVVGFFAVVVGVAAAGFAVAATRRRLSRGERLTPEWTRGWRLFGGSPSASSAARGAAAGAAARPPRVRSNPYEQFEDDPDAGGGYGDGFHAEATRAAAPSESPRVPPTSSTWTSSSSDAPSVHIPIPPETVSTGTSVAGDVELVPPAVPQERGQVLNPFEAAYGRAGEPPARGP